MFNVVKNNCLSILLVVSFVVFSMFSTYASNVISSNNGQKSNFSIFSSSNSTNETEAATQVVENKNNETKTIVSKTVEETNNRQYQEVEITPNVGINLDIDTDNINPNDTVNKSNGSINNVGENKVTLSPIDAIDPVQNKETGIIITKSIGLNANYNSNIINMVEPYYADFLGHIKNRQNMNDDGIILIFNKDADTLLIGDSRVVACCDNPLINSKYDIIALGGCTAKPIYDAIESIDNNKYNRIIIWAMINDFTADLNDGVVLSDMTMKKLDYLLTKSKDHVREGGIVYYIHNIVGVGCEIKNFYDVGIERTENMIREKFKDDVLLLDLNLDYSYENSHDGIHLNDEKLYNSFIERLVNAIKEIEKI